MDGYEVKGAKLNKNKKKIGKKKEKKSPTLGGGTTENIPQKYQT